MPTNLQSETSRRNGAHSRGPISIEGKERVRFNGLKYGIRAKSLLLPGEDPDCLDDLQNRLLDRFQPTDDARLLLVNQLIAAAWRLDRLLSIETTLLSLAMLDSQKQAEIDYQGLTPEDRIAIGYEHACQYGPLNNLHRQINTLTRTVERITRSLTQSQNETPKPAEPVTAVSINKVEEQEEPLESPREYTSHTHYPFSQERRTHETPPTAQTTSRFPRRDDPSRQEDPPEKN